jgi:hypothetical protein
MYALGDMEKKELKTLVALYIKEVDEEQHIKHMTVWQNSYDQHARRQMESDDDNGSVISRHG